MDLARIWSETLIGDTYKKFIFEAIKRSDEFSLAIWKADNQKPISLSNYKYFEILRMSKLNLREIMFDWNSQNKLIKKFNQISLYEYIPFCQQLNKYYVSDLAQFKRYHKRYKTGEGIEELLLCPGGIDNWLFPRYPEDLCFIKNNKIWFYSVAHEHYAFLFMDDPSDVEFWKSIGIKFMESFDYEIDIEGRICLED